MKVAIVHEMLVKLWWAEKVVESMLRLFPNADIYTLMYDETAVWTVFPREQIHPWVFSLPSQRLFEFTKRQRLSLPLMARSIERLDMSDYDIILVSSSGFAHGITTPKKSRTIIYYHAPARYLWDWTHEYRRDIGFHKWLKSILFWQLLKRQRIWDYYAWQKHKKIFANSKTTQSRLKKYYRRDAHVLYPPVETSRFGSATIQQPKTPYYIILSALTEFKRIDIALKHFSLPDNTKLYIIWDGEYRWELEKLAPKSVEFLGAQYGDELVDLVWNSLGLIFPWEEDFGIVPIEVMAAGKPVFALQAGWLTETVIPGKTGDFFRDPEGSDFSKELKKFHKKNLAGTYTVEACKKQADKYSETMFHSRLKKLTQR